MVKINVFSWRHDHIVMLLGCFNASLNAPPTHYRRIGCQSTFQNFIPPDYVPVFSEQKVFNTFNEIALQLMLVFQTLGLNTGLAFRTRLPSVFRTFIAANVNDGTRE